MHPIYNIRIAAVNDLELIIKLRFAFLQELEAEEFIKCQRELEQQTRNYFLRKMQSNELLSWFVADNEGKVVSVASLLVNEMPPTFSDYGGGGNEGYLFNVYTLPEYRSRGLASLLLKHILQEATTRKIGRMWLMHSGDQAARLYENLGFQLREDVMDILLN